MKKLHWTDSEFDRTYFLFCLCLLFQQRGWCCLHLFDWQIGDNAQLRPRCRFSDSYDMFCCNLLVAACYLHVACCFLYCSCDRGFTISVTAYQKHVLHGQETVSIFIANLHAIFNDILRKNHGTLLYCGCSTALWQWASLSWGMFLNSVRPMGSTPFNAFSFWVIFCHYYAWTLMSYWLLFTF